VRLHKVQGKLTFRLHLRARSTGYQVTGLWIIIHIRMQDLINDSAWLLDRLKELHAEIRSTVVNACERSNTAELSFIVRDEEGDTIYAVDRISEDVIIDFFNREIASRIPVVLIAEGLPGGKVVLPKGTDESTASWRIIIDPIDGTRGLMYQKRSAWILTGVARNRGPETSLGDIELAVQTEIPLIKQHLSESLWAVRGQGAVAERFNRLTQETIPITLQPSQARTIAHGYAQVSRFFPGARDELAGIDEEIVMEALGPVEKGKTHCFEDQYASSAGQLYELMSGHDRFTADLRPLMNNLLAQRGLPLGICCHPYDICTELIAREVGVIVSDPFGAPVSAPLNVGADIAWVGYANVEIKNQIEPLLREALERRQL
jgi:fructose-1,6-bisphosphatase/inositol monophosphatase family enzyme